MSEYPSYFAGLYEDSGGRDFGLTLESFAAILREVSDRYAPGAGERELGAFHRGLRLRDLSLARACATATKPPGIVSSTATGRSSTRPLPRSRATNRWGGSWPIRSTRTCSARARRLAAIASQAGQLHGTGIAGRLAPHGARAGVRQPLSQPAPHRPL